MSEPSLTSIKKPKRFVGKKSKNFESSNVDSLDNLKNSVVKSKTKSLAFQIPEEILGDEVLHVVALQFPEGLLMFALTISDILEKYTSAETLVMGDVTYGACCIDDFTARALNCDFLVHYGHSCLVPVDITTIKTMYVFVDIKIDLNHFSSTLKKNFPLNSKEGSKIKFALVSTIQFVASLHLSRELLETDFILTIPQAKPLSGGEILGCTAPKLDDDVEYIIYLGDGRFHLEAIMVANPQIPAFRYDPYSLKFTSEKYDHNEMRSLRHRAVESAKSCKKWGLILGTLGRQGSNSVLEYIKNILLENNMTFTIILLSEIFPSKLSLFQDIDCYIQVACPRLSIDWGYAFEKPLLTPYEFSIVFGKSRLFDLKVVQKDKMTTNHNAVVLQEEIIDYPMDFYSRDSLGPWTPNHKQKKTIN
ncbi:Diphthamide biosynthesis protein 1 [Lobulomyces angularis]|nr:Diphthamide biosynthesis protein 1 [Lobulomyces angularis]